MYKLLDKVSIHILRSHSRQAPQIVIAIVVVKFDKHYEVAWSESLEATIKVAEQDILSCVGSMSIEEGLIDSREVIRRAALAQQSLQIA